MYIGTGDLLEAADSVATPDSGEPVGNDWLTARLAWYTVLLRQTLDFACRTVPFYRDQKLDPNAFNRISDLRLFPILDKQDIAGAPEAFVSTEARPDSFRCTSGTTGRRLIVYGNEDEERAASALLELRAPLREGEYEVSLRLFPNCLRVFAPPARSRSNVYTIIINYSLSQTHRQWFDNSDHLIEILNGEYLLGDGRAHRVTSIHATPPYLVEFATQQLIQKGVSLGDFGVTKIATSGGFVTRDLRRSLEKLWGCEVYTSFSCSEINGASTESADSPGDYLLSPSMFCEILDIHSGEPVGEGESGHLVITSLHPFQSTMPMLRYNTGDIAQRIPLDGHPGGHLFFFRPIGRRQHCIEIADRVFLGTRDVLEATASFDALPKFPYPRYRLEAGAPRSGHPAVTVFLESVDLREAERRRMEGRLETAIREEFNRRHAGFSCPEVNLTVRLVSKGHLEHSCKLYPDR